MKAPSPFDWASSPSLLAAELKPLKTGKTRSQTASSAVKRKEARTGRNPGTVYGISKTADAAIHPRRGKR